MPIPVQFPVLDEAKPFAAHLRLQKMRDQELDPNIVDYPLSGFPRTFAAEQERLLTSSQRRQSALRRERSRPSVDQAPEPVFEADSTSIQPQPAQLSSESDASTSLHGSNIADAHENATVRMSGLGLEETEGELPKELHANDVKTDSTVISPARAPRSPEKPRAIVKFAYVAPEENQLTITVGEELEVHQTESSGWSLCWNRDKDRGWVPTAYLEEVR